MVFAHSVRRDGLVPILPYLDSYSLSRWTTPSLFAHNDSGLLHKLRRRRRSLLSTHVVNIRHQRGPEEGELGAATTNDRVALLRDRRPVEFAQSDSPICPETAGRDWTGLDRTVFANHMVESSDRGGSMVATKTWEPPWPAAVRLKEER